MNSGESLRMVSVATFVSAHMVSPLVATTTAVCSVWLLPLRSSNCRRAASMLSGLDRMRLVEHEHLVGADHIGPGGKIAHGLGLGPRQHLGDVMGVKRALAADGLAHHAFIEARRLDDEGKSRRFEQLGPRLARRGEDQGRPPRLQKALMPRAPALRGRDRGG